MTTPESSQQPSEPKGADKPVAPRSTMDTLRIVVFTVIAVVLIIFAIINSHDVQVDYLFGTDQWPLIVVIVISVALGAAADRLLVFRRRRRAKKQP